MSYSPENGQFILPQFTVRRMVREAKQTTRITASELQEKVES